MAGLLSEGKAFEAVKGRGIKVSSYKKSSIDLDSLSATKDIKAPPAGFFSALLTGILSISLAKIHIVRDHFQLTGVIFGSSFNTLVGLAKTCSDVFGGIGEIVSFNFVEGLQLDATAAIGTLIVVFGGAAVSFAAYWTITCGPLSGIVKDRQSVARQGHENTDLAHISRNHGWKIHAVKLTLLIVTSLMLGVVQACFEILFCDRSSSIMSYYLEDGQSCSDLSNYDGLKAFAFIMLFAFLILLPADFGTNISKHVPGPDGVGHIIDNEGEVVQFNDKVYQDKISSDRNQVLNPYKDMYVGLRYPYRYFNMYMIAFKTILCAITVYLSSRNEFTDGVKDTYNAIAALVLMLIMAGFQFKYNPFSSPNDQIIEHFGCVTRVLTPLASLISIALGVDSSASQAIGAIIFLIHIIGFLAIVSYTVHDFPGVINAMRRMAGRARYTNTSEELDGLLGSEAIAKWQLDREIKHRVWQPFWISLIEEKFKVEGTKKCFSKKKKNPVMQRLSSLCDSVRVHGTKVVKEYWEKYWSIMDDGLKTDLLKLQGRDVVYKNRHGKFYVYSFPLKGVFVPDQIFEVQPLDYGEMRAIIQQNKTDEAKESIKIRKILRAIAAGNPRRSKISFGPAFDFTLGNNVKLNSVAITGDAIVMVKVSEGSTESLEMNHDGIEMEAGFNFEVYTKGEGPGDSVTYRLFKSYQAEHGNESILRTEDLGPIIGLKGGDMVKIEDENLWNQFVKAANDGGVPVEENLNAIQAEEEAYRAKFIEQDLAEQSLLCDTFHEFVFNNPAINRDHLEFYLRNREVNPNVKALADDKEALNFIYEKMACVLKSEASLLWYVFWDAFWESNEGSTMVHKNAGVFDPSEPRCIAYNLMKRSELEDKLASLGIRLVDKDTLDALYARLKSPNEYPKIEFEAPELEACDACMTDCNKCCDLILGDVFVEDQPDPTPLEGGIGRKEMWKSKDSMVYIKDVKLGHYVTVDSQKCLKVNGNASVQPCKFVMRDIYEEEPYWWLGMKLEVVDAEGKASGVFVNVSKNDTLSTEGREKSACRLKILVQDDKEKDHYGALILEDKSGPKVVADGVDGIRLAHCAVYGSDTQTENEENPEVKYWTFVRSIDGVADPGQIMIRDDSIIDGITLRKNAQEINVIHERFFKEATKRGALTKTEMSLPTSIAESSV